MKIYEVALYSKVDCMPVQSFYFLFYRQARKFVEKHAEELKYYRIGIGAERLHLL
ncbi:MAG: hypothetical protein IKL53_10205 [Lachnospiraceae bacterium]|nr:hypothetical protein [Lachnospiraceae bacterium]